MTTDDRDAELARLIGEGDRAGLFAHVYDELRGLAGHRMVPEGRGHTLQATALVHEVFLRLSADRGSTWEDRRHFFAAAIEAMRRILIEHARRARSQKRGGGALRVTLGAADNPIELDLDQAAAVHEALERLEEEDERAAEVARLRFLLGLTVEETAAALDLSVRTVHREWTFARARLFELLG